MGNNIQGEEGKEEQEEQEEKEEGEEEKEKDISETPTTTITIAIENKTTQTLELFHALLDTGTTHPLVTAQAMKRAGITTKETKTKKWKTAAGVFQTTKQAKIRKHRILSLNSKRILTGLEVNVIAGDLGKFDFILGRTYLTRYGIDLLFSDRTIEWDGMKSPMPPNNDRKALRENRFAQQILDSSYKEYDASDLAKQQKHLTLEQQNQLQTLFEKYHDSFSGKLGTWPGEKVEVELLPNATPYHCVKPIRIPHIHYDTLKKEVYRLVEIGVLEEVDGERAGPWCAPSFIIPKKDGRVRFITDFRELNRRIRRKPWPMPHITDLLQDIGPYTYVTALDLSMGFYHFELSDETSEMATFMLPFGLFKYKRLPMGLSVSPDLLQSKMAQLFSDCSNIKIYMDDILIFSNGSFEEHLKQVDMALQRLQSKNMAVNVLKSYWAVSEVDYLGFRLTKQGVLPQPKKVQAIIDMERPKTKRQLRRFIGMVNYYRYMWKKRSHLLAPLATLAGKNSVFTWTEKHTQAFEAVKAIVSQEVMLSFPDYSQPFELYVDASDKQLGAVLMQGEKALAFFSKKLNACQEKYGVGEKEMLSVVEALKQFRTMILGYPIHVFTDHKNWTHDKNYTNARVMRWRLMMEDYAPTIHYVKGEKNVVADTLSRNPINTLTAPEEDTYSMTEECWDMASWRRSEQLITMQTIGKEQSKDKFTKQVMKNSPDAIGELFEDIGSKDGPVRVTTIKDPIDNKFRVLVPQTLQRRLLLWYHRTLLHPGGNRLYETLRQHFTWPK
jgi:hypothetical protein